MCGLKHLIENNRKWARETRLRNPDFFLRLSRQQSPEYLWIGCSDSRVPANAITGLLPGEIFVHRNVANMVGRSDANCLSVLQYAVDVLKVKHIIVCGHYGCGGVRVALEDGGSGMIEEWLRPIKNTAATYGKALSAIPTRDKRADKLCELNVLEQVRNVAQTMIVGRAWTRGQPLVVHGWIYRLTDGHIRPLGIRVTAETNTPSLYRKSLDRLLKGLETKKPCHPNKKRRPGLS